MSSPIRPEKTRETVELLAGDLRARFLWNRMAHVAPPGCTLKAANKAVRRQRFNERFMRTGLRGSEDAMSP